MWPLLLRPDFWNWGSSSGACASPLCRWLRDTFTMPRRPGEVGFILMTAMLCSLPGQLELLARLQGHVRLAHVVPTANGLAEALGLALGVHHGHALDLDLEQQLHCGLDLVLGRV